MIALHGPLWPDEIRDPAAVVPPPVQLDDDEVDEAVALSRDVATRCAKRVIIFHGSVAFAAGAAAAGLSPPPS
ncbi:hypothetical protein [Streptomyces sp. NPDC047453]|uniref:hypothetical protein n=1 Tax=Streptomyces sp. NPDC047453 TaxID=3154812 RepID=UPI0033EDD2BA